MRKILSGARKGAVGSKPTLVTQYVLNHCGEGTTILDYGAGRFLQQVGHLFHSGFYWVRALDRPANETYWTNPGLRHKQGRRYSVVMLSNVLNVQESSDEVDAVLADAWDKVARGGALVCNYPKSPRYSGLNKSNIKRRLQALDPGVAQVDGVYVLCKEE